MLRNDSAQLLIPCGDDLIGFHFACFVCSAHVVLCAAGVYCVPTVHARGPLQFHDVVCNVKCGAFCSIDFMACAVGIFAVSISQSLAWLFRARHCFCW